MTRRAPGRALRPTKESLDIEVARELGLPIASVREITTRFVERACAALAQCGGLIVTGLGHFSVSRSRTPRVHHGVHFSAGKTLVRALKERKEPMEKYAVDEQPSPSEKTAARGCPACGQKAENHGGIWVCPEHGSEPFESGPPRTE